MPGYLNIKSLDFCEHLLCFGNCRTDTVRSGAARDITCCNCRFKVDFQHIFVKKVVVSGGPADGNVNLLDTDGVLRFAPGRHDGEPQNQLDPRVVVSGAVAADSRTEYCLGYRVRGLFLDDVPEGGKVEVYHGSEDVN